MFKIEILLQHLWCIRRYRYFNFTKSTFYNICYKVKDPGYVVKVILPNEKLILFNLLKLNTKKCAFSSNKTKQISYAATQYKAHIATTHHTTPHTVRYANTINTHCIHYSILNITPYHTHHTLYQISYYAPKHISPMYMYTKLLLHSNKMIILYYIIITLLSFMVVSFDEYME